MGGLSPEQAHQLIYADWNDPDGPIRFKRDLTLAKLSNAEILLNARKFLTMLVEQDGKTKTTQSGYLTRVFVAEAMERFIFEEGYLETARKYNKVINETDIYPIHIIRIVLEFSSLLRKRKGAFHITRKGREMLREENAGELFTLLFITFFRKFNLTYLDRLPENPYLQHGVNYMLYRLGECARKWTDREDLALNLSLPKVQENAITPTGHNLLSSLVETRFLRPLMRFGLVERRVDDERILEYKCSYRVTPLYKAFLEIHV